MTEKRRLIELDTLRGVAALLVCFLHFFLFKYGITGLDLFFMISGFVIYMSIANAKSLKYFWTARFLRLYPVYWLSIIIALLFCYACRINLFPLKWNFVLGNLTMLQPIFKAEFFVGVYWTLYVEMMFYVLISILWGLKLLTKIEAVILAFLAASVLFHGLFLFWENPGYARFFVVVRGAAPLISHFHFFAAGIIFYRVYSKGISFFRVTLLVISFLLIPLVHSVGGRAFYFINVVEHLCCCLAFYTLFMLIIYKKADFLKVKYFSFFGDISYALYLVHGTFGIWLSIYLLPHVGSLLSNCIGIIASLLLSYLITYYYDQPIRYRFKKRTVKAFS